MYLIFLLVDLWIKCTFVWIVVICRGGGEAHIFGWMSETFHSFECVAYTGTQEAAECRAKRKNDDQNSNNEMLGIGNTWSLCPESLLSAGFSALRVLSAQSELVTSCVQGSYQWQRQIMRFKSASEPEALLCFYLVLRHIHLSRELCWSLPVRASLHKWRFHLKWRSRAAFVLKSLEWIPLLSDFHFSLLLI